MPEYYSMMPMGVFPLYHWSPSVNRQAILDGGLKIRSQATQGNWKPPYVAFALSPQLAWLLSGARTDYDVIHPEWDLWSVWSQRLGSWELLMFDNQENSTKELRVYKSIPAKHLWHVGTRTRELSGN